MGQLRSGILDLQKFCLELDPKIKAIDEKNDEYKNRVWSAAERITGGFEVSTQYLIEKFKKVNQTLEANKAKPLKDCMDPQLATLIKGIQSAKDDVKKMITGFNGELKSKVAALMQSVTQADTKAAALKAIAEKKKKKLLVSAKYKDKIKTYLGALDAVDKLLDKGKKTVAELAAITQDHAWVDRNFKLTGDMKVGDIADSASMNFNSQMTTYLKDKEEIDKRVRVFRDDYKNMGLQLGIMKKWMDEAEGMEKEAEEKK